MGNSLSGNKLYFIIIKDKKCLLKAQAKIDIPISEL